MQIKQQNIFGFFLNTVCQLQFYKNKLYREPRFLDKKKPFRNEVVLKILIGYMEILILTVKRYFGFGLN